MDAPPIQIDKHPPERRRRTPERLYFGACCCCCCCVHAVGSLIGAALAPRFIPDATEVTMYNPHDSATVPKQRWLSAAVLFWSVLAFLVFLGFLYGILNWPTSPEALTWTAVIIAFLLPGLQLVSAVFAAFLLMCWPRADSDYQLHQLGKIALGTLLGAILGGGVMAGLGVLASFFR